MNIKYLKINIEDHDSVQIKMGFPVAYNFIDTAFNETKDFYKSAYKNNGLIDDVYHS